MLVGHLVPAYFATVKSRLNWAPQWTRQQRVALWIAALGSTVAPDTDVIYNALFRGFFGHTYLLTHSLFLHLGVVLVWGLLNCIGRWPYIQTLIGLVAVGGLSHLLLDVVAHSTPLLYPMSMFMFGAPSQRVMRGGICNYLTDPVVLIELVVIAVGATHWITCHLNVAPRFKKIAILGLASGLLVVSVGFLFWLPELQRIADTRGVA